MGADYKRRLTYIGMRVGNIGARTCCLMELHFLPVLFVLFRGLLQTHALIRSASKYSLKKIEKLEHTLFLGSDQWATSAIHSSSVMFCTGEVALTSFAGTPLKYFFFNL